jgi:WD40 repeat protein/uncharacterized caspase-like protein
MDMKRWAAMGGRLAALALAFVFMAAPAPSVAQDAARKVELVTQVGHRIGASKAVMSRDKRLLATGVNQSIKIWDVEKGLELRSLQGQPPHLSGLAISVDGRSVASISQIDPRLRLWDTASGRLVHTLTSPEGRFHSMAFSADGRTILAGDDRQVRQYDVTTGREIWSIDESRYGSPVVAMAVADDGASVVMSRAGGSLDRWDIRTRRKLWTADLSALTESVGLISALAISPDMRTAAAIARRAPGPDTTDVLTLWDMATGRLLRRSHRDLGQQRTLSFMDVAFSSDSRTVIAASEATATFYDAGNGARLREMRIDGAINALAPDGQSVLASNSGEEKTKLWDLDNGQLAQAYRGRVLSMRRTQFSPDGRYMLTEHSEGSTLWDAATGRSLRTTSHTRGIFSADGRTIVAANGNTVTVIDAITGKELRAFSGHNDAILAIVLPSDERILVTLDSKRMLKVWDMETGRELRSSRLNDNAWPGRFLPNSHTLLLISDKLLLIDAESGREQRRFGAVGYNGKVSVVSRDGTTVTTHSPAHPGSFIVWNIATGRQVRTVRAHDSIDQLVLSHDGKAYISAGDRSIRLWDAGSGRRLAEIDLPGQAYSLDISHLDGSWVAVLDGKTLQRSSRQGALLATSVVGSDGEWLTITPEGFFDGSPNGTRLVAAVQDLKTVAVDQVYQALYRPDLVQEKLAGDPRGLVRAAAAKLDLEKVLATGGAPHVTLAGPTTARAEAIEVNAALTDRGGGIGNLEWRVNGVTVGVQQRGFDRFNTGLQRAEPRIISRRLTLAPGENVIEVLAYNAANLIASSPARLMVKREGGPEAARPRLHVLSVGVNDYRDSRLRLSFATVDAKAWSDALRRAGTAFYESVEATTVLDEDVTAANLDKTFTTLSSKVGPEDVFAFFIAGHGKTVDGRYYFLPQDFRYAGEESIVSQGIGQDKWQEWFARIPARKSLLLYDTCESGSLTGSGVAMRGIGQLAALERMTRATGRTTLTASTDDAPALEGYRGHGVFTYALLDALGKADVNNDGLIDITELASFVDTEVPELSFQAFRQRQFPQMRIVGSNFPIVPRAALLAERGLTTVPTGTKPTHVVISPAEVFAQPAATVASTAKLTPGTTVTVVRTEHGWTLVAKEGKPLGYVAPSSLAAMQ